MRVRLCPSGLHFNFMTFIAVFSNGTSHTDAPCSDHRKNRGVPVQKAKCSVLGDHAMDRIGFSCSISVASDREVMSQIQTAPGVVSHRVARNRLSHDHSQMETPIGWPASPCLTFSALSVMPSDMVAYLALFVVLVS